MLDFDLLRALVAVAECGGFRRAAERLHLTQSMVSQQLKRLELEAARPRPSHEKGVPPVKPGKTASEAYQANRDASANLRLVSQTVAVEFAAVPSR